MYDLAYPKNSIELLWDELESNIKKTTTEQDMAKSRLSICYIEYVKRLLLLKVAT